MAITEAKELISEKLGWIVRDVFFLCKDVNMFSYYLVYKNHRIRNVVSIDELQGCVSGIWE